MITQTQSEIRHPRPLSPTRHPAPTLHMCQLRPSYDHSTNSTPPRYKSRFFSYEGVESPYLRVDTNPPNVPSPNHDEIRQPTLTRPKCPMLHMCQLRPSYDHATNATPLRYKSLFSRYEKCSMPLSERRTRPPKNPRPTPRRNPPIPSHSRNPPPWNCPVQYEPATAVERMERLSDTNNVLTDTDRVPLPICDGTAPHPDSRPIRHYETRPQPQRPPPPQATPPNPAQIPPIPRCTPTSNLLT